MTTRANQIVLSGEFRQEEYKVNVTVTPGHLVELYNNSGTAEIRKHSTAGGYAERMFAIENAVQGLPLGISAGSAGAGGITADTAYPAGDIAFCALMQRGAVVSARLKGGTNYTIGMKLISDGAGNLQRDTTDSAVISKDVIGVIVEPLDLSASAGVPAARGVVRIL